MADDPYKHVGLIRRRHEAPVPRLVTWARTRLRRRLRRGAV